MKTYLYLLLSIGFCANSFASLPQEFAPGCLRKNSDNLRKDLLFMHLESNHFDLSAGILDEESIHYTKGGKTIDYICTEIQQTFTQQQLDDKDLQRSFKSFLNNLNQLRQVDQLKKQRLAEQPVSEMPD